MEELNHHLHIAAGTQMWFIMSQLPGSPLSASSVAFRETSIWPGISALVACRTGYLKVCACAIVVWFLGWGLQSSTVIARHLQGCQDAYHGAGYLEVPSGQRDGSCEGGNWLWVPTATLTALTCTRRRTRWGWPSRRSSRSRWWSMRRPVHCQQAVEHVPQQKPGERSLPEDDQQPGAGLAGLLSYSLADGLQAWECIFLVGCKRQCDS